MTEKKKIQTCRHCLDPNSVISEDTCCTGCSILEDRNLRMMKWIKVADEKPKEKSDFLGTNGEILFSAYWSDDYEKYIVGGWESCCYCGGTNVVVFDKPASYEVKVTHWMPLPKPPEDK